MVPKIIFAVAERSKSEAEPVLYFYIRCIQARVDLPDAGFPPCRVRINYILPHLIVQMIFICVCVVAIADGGVQPSGRVGKGLGRTEHASRVGMREENRQ